MQHVLDGYVALDPISGENPLPQNLNRSTRAQATKLKEQCESLMRTMTY